MNIPPGNVNIPSSKFKLPHCKLNEFYPFDNDQIRRKITLKIYTGNDKESKNLVIRKTKWKSIFDVKKYVMEQNHEYTFDRQSIKYMGEVISNNNITFEEMDCKSEMILDIVIEELSLRSIVDDKILIDNIFHVNSSLIGKRCLNKQTNEIVFLKGFYTYGIYIVAHAEGLISKLLMYINCNKLTLIDESSSKRTRVKSDRYCDMIFNFSPKINLNKISFQHWIVLKTVPQQLITKMAKKQFLKTVP